MSWRFWKDDERLGVVIGRVEDVLDYVMEDYMVLENYVQSFENGVVTGNDLRRTETERSCGIKQ